MGPTRSTRVRTRAALKCQKATDEPGPTPTSIPSALPQDSEADDSDMKPLAIDTLELNSSPIRPTRAVAVAGGSSPISKKKSVAFSDELVVDFVSSPIKVETPRKSILKTCNVNIDSSPNNPNNPSLWIQKTENLSQGYGPSHSNFWLQGNIVQLVPNSPELPMLIAGCIKVLQDSTFKKRFEVYATLNNACKTNNPDHVLKFFRDNEHDLVILTQLIKGDVVLIESKLFNSEEFKENVLPTTKNDPFRIRIVTQALKLLNFFMSDENLNGYLPIEDVKWIYTHASSMLVKQNISKALVSPYLMLIKDCRFTGKRKKLIFDNTDIADKMLSSLLNMKPLISSSIMSEKFICFRNYINNFPGVMGKRNFQWMGILVFQICSVPPSFTKCITVGVNALLEAAKVFLDNRNALMAVKQFLASPIPLELVSQFPEQYSSPNDQWTKDDTCIDYLVYKIQGLINNGQYRSGIDMWLAITLLLGNSEPNLEKWNLIDKWLQIPKYCFVSDNSLVRLSAICSWRAIVYSICPNGISNLGKLVESITRNTAIKDKQAAISNTLGPKIKLLMSIFSLVNPKELSHEELEALNNIHLMILYSLINSSSGKNTKYLHVYWDKIMQPLFHNFYFNNDSHPFLHHLGLKLVVRLLQNSQPITEKSFNSLRCLLNEDITLNEINSLPPRWVYTKFDRIMQTMVLMFQLQILQLQQKINVLNSFFNSIKHITKKEPKASDSTYDLIDSLPYLYTSFFKFNKVTYDTVHKLIINLHDTFDPDSLVDRGNEKTEVSSNRSIHQAILSKTIMDMTSSQQAEIFGLILSSISDKNSVIFLVEMYGFRTESPSVEGVVLHVLSSRKIICNKVELKLYGGICQTLTAGFEVFVKRLLQSVIDSGDLKRSLEYLEIDNWSQETFNFYLLLVRNSPNKKIKEFTEDLLGCKIDDKTKLVELIKFLIKFEFDSEIYHIRVQILKSSIALEGSLKEDFGKIWSEYLQHQCKQSSSNDQCKGLLLSTTELLENEVAEIANSLLKSQIPLPIESQPNAPAVDGDMTNDSGSAITPTSEVKDEPAKQADVKEETGNEGQTTIEPELSRSNVVKNEVSQKKKAKSPVTRLKGNKKAAKSKKEISVVETSSPIGQFDIHSFTALLNAKLSTPAPQTPPTPPTPALSKRTTRRRRASAKAKASQEVKEEESTNETPIVEEQAIVPPASDDISEAGTLESLSGHIQIASDDTIDIKTCDEDSENASELDSALKRKSDSDASEESSKRQCISPAIIDNAETSDRDNQNKELEDDQSLFSIAIDSIMAETKENETLPEISKANETGAEVETNNSILVDPQLENYVNGSIEQVNDAQNNTLQNVSDQVCLDVISSGEVQMLDTQMDEVDTPMEELSEALVQQQESVNTQIEPVMAEENLSESIAPEEETISKNSENLSSSEKDVGPWIDELSFRMKDVTNEQIKQLPLQKRHELETQLLEFMLRMRSVETESETPK